MVSGFPREFIVVNWITGFAVEKPRHLFPCPLPPPTPLLRSRQSILCEMYKNVNNVKKKLRPTHCGASKCVNQNLTAIITHGINSFRSGAAFSNWSLRVSAGNDDHRLCIFLNRHSHNVNFLIYTFDQNTFKGIQSIRWVNYFLAMSKVKIFRRNETVEILNASGGEIWLKISILEDSSWTRDI